MARTPARWLLIFFGLLEEGCPWPGDLRYAKATFIAKPSTLWHDPLTFRILMILPYCYRSWAKLRLRRLTPRIRTWATEDMFAVNPGTGADAAWYRSAALREEALMQSKPFSGPATTSGRLMTSSPEKRPLPPRLRQVCPRDLPGPISTSTSIWRFAVG